MHRLGLLSVACVVAFAVLVVSADDGRKHHEYCVIGAGPGGLQISYFLHKAGRDYIVYEKGPTAGTFYTKYPIHRTLISINKRNTGKTNKEFNFRHDWNSLISDDESLVLGEYSREIFPHADHIVQYMKDFVRKLDINIKYNTKIGNLKQRNPKDGRFHVNDQYDNEYTCTRIIVATGIDKPNEFEDETARNLVTGYQDLSIDLDDFEGKSVLILGLGNSAFETSQYIMGSTNFIHMLGRARVKLAWSTHYVGDLRAVNNGLLDTYQLKSLDGIGRADIDNMQFGKNPLDGKIYVGYNGTGVEDLPQFNFDNFPFREGYDMVIACLGFRFDPSLFDKSIDFDYRQSGHVKKYPKMTGEFESEDIPGVFFAGTNTHVLDYKRSAGGFIHGFRYSGRTLHRILENKFHNVSWPHVKFDSAIDVIPHLIKRVSEASDIYQMFGVLCEIMIFSEDNTKATYLPAYPCALVPSLPRVSGHAVPGKLVVAAMEYGKNASGPAKDVFRDDRSTEDNSKAHTSNFLHPVLYYFKSLPTEAEYNDRPAKWILPIPDQIHHIVEDFTTVFDAPVSHVLGVRRFFEHLLEKDLRQFYVEQCMVANLLSTTLPESCKMHDMRGSGISPPQEQKHILAGMNPWLIENARFPIS